MRGEWQSQRQHKSGNGNDSLEHAGHHERVTEFNALQRQRSLKDDALPLRVRVQCEIHRFYGGCLITSRYKTSASTANHSLVASQISVSPFSTNSAIGSLIQDIFFAAAPLI